MRTNFLQEKGESFNASKDSPSISGPLDTENQQTVKFPKKRCHKGRGRIFAAICRRSDQPQRRNLSPLRSTVF
jgi:hypothetical protein